jgi:signal transduction histidine kinase
MKTEFVSLVSHELRTPMTSVRGFTDLLLEGDAGPLDARVHEYLEIIKVNADRLISLINDVLDITRLEAGHVELRRDLYSIAAIIDAIVQTMYPLIESRKQCLVVRVAPSLPPVWVDLERMTQIISNLVGNASKYTPNDGEITIEARLIDNPDDLAVGAPGNVFLPAVLVSVHDTGIGIAPQEQAHLFTRFYRTEQASRRQISGTGLGLTIVKSFVELHGGHVWVHSEIEHGSSFYFTIPLLGGA